MDKYIAAYPFIEDDDLNFCIEYGVAYQRDMTKLIEYGEKYFNNYVSLKGSQIANQLNMGRKFFVKKYFQGEVLDVGIGSGEFIQSRPDTFGYDVNQHAINWLLANGKYRDDFSEFSAFTFWDVIEHIPEPENYFRNMLAGSFLFTSIPTFQDLLKVRQSKHYKPGEHLYYFTMAGFVQYMAKHGFENIGLSTFENQAGRQGITSFAFRKITQEQ